MPNNLLFGWQISCFIKTSLDRDLPFFEVNDYDLTKNMFDGWKYKTRFLIPPNGFCHTPCPITLKICLPRQEILAFSHFFSASRPPRLNILSCRSQQSSLLLCFPGYYVSIFFEFFSIIKPLKTMWSRFFSRSMLNLGQKSTLWKFWCWTEDVKRAARGVY